jgi:hypothetical protein
VAKKMRANVLLATLGGSWYAKFGVSLCHLLLDFGRHMDKYEEPGLRLLSKAGSILPNMRQQCLTQAIQWGCSHLLFIDSDQVFPADTLRRLLAWEKPVVACNIAVKRFPSTTTARLKDPKNPEQGEVVYTHESSVGLKEVWRVGTGVMLIRIADIARVPSPEGFFPVRFKPSVNDYQGEDWGFCEVLEKAGVPIFIDQRLSWEVGHLGEMKYEHSLIEATFDSLRFVEEARQDAVNVARARAPRSIGHA